MQLVQLVKVQHTSWSQRLFWFKIMHKSFIWTSEILYQILDNKMWTMSNKEVKYERLIHVQMIIDAEVHLDMLEFYSEVRK